MLGDEHLGNSVWQSKEGGRTERQPDEVVHEGVAADDNDGDEEEDEEEGWQLREDLCFPFFCLLRRITRTGRGEGGEDKVEGERRNEREKNIKEERKEKGSLRGKNRNSKDE